MIAYGPTMTDIHRIQTLASRYGKGGDPGVLGMMKVMLEDERERCAKICDEGAAKNDGDAAAVLMAAADLIRNPVE